MFNTFFICLICRCNSNGYFGTLPHNSNGHHNFPLSPFRRWATLPSPFVAPIAMINNWSVRRIRTPKGLVITASLTACSVYSYPLSLLLGMHPPRRPMCRCSSAIRSLHTKSPKMSLRCRFSIAMSTLFETQDFLFIPTIITRPPYRFDCTYWCQRSQLLSCQRERECSLSSS